MPFSQSDSQAKMKLCTLALSTAVLLRFFGQSHSWIETVVIVTPISTLNYSHPVGYPRGYGLNNLSAL